MELDRADMKLLIEAGYSGVMRGIDTDLTPIFQAIADWMPQYAAGRIGLAMQTMVRGDFAGADQMLTAIVASDMEGRTEAQAILAMCKALQNQHQDAREIAQELEGTGGYAEGFTDALVNGGPETTQGYQGLALEAETTPVRHGDHG
ncbi:MAG: hypothetical protein Q4G24_08930 [Paracoccus sp. (in: a-proteobacteria)]|uniref:hypothetical protein n=1 Tax=Paracoccus sp. TaxID=267 RepID=UPI0026E05637|nr:hypothetical protein [Paracoccus sp. (in: a-proteobacteria)]MDO5621578.1 hypothetical protein [Paracoccus sp. (in: a-proteobacteria)]